MSMKRFSYIFGISMAVIMALSVILPALSNNNTPIQQPTPQPTAIPTFPPPPQPESISFDQTYLHPSGLFTVAEPTGWQASQPQTTSSNARAVLSNPDAQSLIQVDVEKPASMEDGAITLDDVDTLFNTSWLSSSWREYSSWNESSRERTENEHLVIDFELTSNNQTYVARQEAWTDGDWIYSVRVVTPQNATETLLYLLEGVAESLNPQKEFASTPFGWDAYFDPQDTHIVRYPADWVLSDSAPGRPTSITNDDIALRVESEAGTVIDSEDAAAGWVESLRQNANVLSVEPVTRDDNEGYSVAYSYRTVDGETQSGYAVLLNGPEEKLHVANLLFSSGEVDLNDPAEQEARPALADVMASFKIMPELANVDTGAVASG